MKKIIFLSIFLLFLSGCGAIRLDTYIGMKIMPSYVVSAERVKIIAPQFKASWGFASGLIRGNIYYTIFAPKVVQDLMDRLDDIHKKSKDDSWTDSEQAEMVTKIVQLEYEAGKFIRDQYGDQIMAIVRSIAGI